VPEDLQETARLLTLFEQAQTHGLIGKSDSERLTFLGLAEHAKVVGASNPCGLFAALVRRQCWHFVTDSDEDAAHQRLKAYLYGVDHQTRALRSLTTSRSPHCPRMLPSCGTSRPTGPCRI
jgi:hypothetical protein